jgi:16S rRNA (uracil1498-N3)-methyltransferase
MQRYFIRTSVPEGKVFSVADDNLHHMLNVMRMKEGDQAILVFEDEIAIRSKIVQIEEDAVVYEKIEQIKNEVELPVAITVASAFSKGDKVEWVTQKSTELGAYSFLFFPGERSISKWDGRKLAKKAQRLQKIAQEATEQSHRTHIPKVKMCEKLSDFVAELANYHHILIAYEETAKQGDKSALFTEFNKILPGETVLVIFGPEGGLSENEVEAFQDAGGVPVGLGPRILRTETAPLYLLASASFYLEMQNHD